MAIWLPCLNGFHGLNIYQYSLNFLKKPFFYFLEALVRTQFEGMVFLIDAKTEFDPFTELGIKLLLIRYELWALELHYDPSYFSASIPYISIHISKVIIKKNNCLIGS